MMDGLALTLRLALRRNCHCFSVRDLWLPQAPKCHETIIQNNFIDFSVLIKVPLSLCGPDILYPSQPEYGYLGSYSFILKWEAIYWRFIPLFLTLSKEIPMLLYTFFYRLLLWKEISHTTVYISTEVDIAVDMYMFMVGQESMFHPRSG